jgi:hypothetical protein
LESICLVNSSQLLAPLRERVGSGHWEASQTIGDLFGTTFAALLKVRGVQGDFSLSIVVAG